MNKIQLPDIKLFNQHPNNREFGWSDHYGAIKVAERYVGNKIAINHYHQWFFWSHGCQGPWLNIHPGILTHFLENKNLKYLLINKTQEIYLKNYGFKNVKAIGLPFIYVNEVNLQRIPNSLLIMPSHTLLGDKKLDKEAYESYTDFIKPFLTHFSVVKACIHYSCIRNNMWVDEFNKLGIEIIEGARTDDENALLRQTYLFKQFDFVTTNSWGSHVAYGLFHGCKVSIAGPFFPRPKEDFLRDGKWKRNPSILDIILSKEIEENKNELLKELFTLPNEAKTNVEFGRQLVGYYDKKTPAELLKIIKPSNFEVFKFNVSRVLRRLKIKK